jgi:hypothetical protein
MLPGTLHFGGSCAQRCVTPTALGRNQARSLVHRRTGVFKKPFLPAIHRGGAARPRLG